MRTFGAIDSRGRAACGAVSTISFIAHLLNGQHLNAARLLFEAASTKLSMVSVQQPEFWDERGFDDSTVENTDHAALGDDDGNLAQLLRDRRSTTPARVNADVVHFFETAAAGTAIHQLFPTRLGSNSVAT